MTALLTLAKGTSIVTEGIWENRFRYVDELIHMGANIQVDGQVAVIEGVKELHPAPLRATDLRAGAAMVDGCAGQPTAQAKWMRPSTSSAAMRTLWRNCRPWAQISVVWKFRPMP